MVIDQLQTTYRRDYVRPYVGPLHLKSNQEAPCADPKICRCTCLKDQYVPGDQKKLYGVEGEENEWTRIGPMGPLLDPKLYPVKVSAGPESDVVRYNQPNAFLQKLKGKYPFIYECIKNAHPNDFISRINRDRLRSTYQVDFCGMQEFPAAPFDEIARASGIGGAAPCCQSARFPGDPERANEKSIASRPATISNRVGGGKATGASAGGTEKKSCVGTCHGPLAGVTAGATEYQDAISRLGQIIIREKIHH